MQAGSRRSRRSPKSAPGSAYRHHVVRIVSYVTLLSTPSVRVDMAPPSEMAAAAAPVTIPNVPLAHS